MISLVLAPSYVADGKCLNVSSKIGVMNCLIPVRLIHDSIFFSSRSNTFCRRRWRVRELTKSHVACIGVYWAQVKGAHESERGRA